MGQVGNVGDVEAGAWGARTQLKYSGIKQSSSPLYDICLIQPGKVMEVN